MYISEDNKIIYDEKILREIEKGERKNKFPEIEEEELEIN